LAHDFDPKNPWDYCSRKCINQECPTATKYWKKYVEQPCNFVLTRGDKVSKHVDTDCAIAATPDDHVATGGVSFGNGSGPSQPGVARAPKIKQPQQPPVAKVNDQNQLKGHSTKDKNGCFLTNIKGRKLCANYNLDKCPGRCSDNNAHQCNVCLANNHNAVHCPNAAKPGAKKGKGRGKGGKKF
jgi:hypothetical protein